MTKVNRCVRNFLIFLTLMHPDLGIAATLSAAEISGLNFGRLFIGDSATTIVPESGQANAASIQVAGDPNAAYSIIITASSTELITGAGSLSNEKIAITNINTLPAAGANGVLDGNGKQVIYLGATRAAIPGNQVPGSYTGSIEIVFTY